MTNGIENGYYHEITPSGFGIAIKAGKVLFSEQSDFQKVEIFETESRNGKNECARHRKKQFGTDKDKAGGSEI